VVVMIAMTIMRTSTEIVIETCLTPVSRKSPRCATSCEKSGLDSWSASQQCSIQLYLVTDMLV